MKHETCKYYDDFITMLENEQEGFLLKKFADEVGCSTERIRRIRIGVVQMDINDVSVLVKNYRANPMFLIAGALPMRIDGNSNMANEPSEKYLSAQEQITMLKALCESKDQIIQLQQERLKDLGKGNAKRA